MTTVQHADFTRAEELLAGKILAFDPACPRALFPLYAALVLAGRPAASDDIHVMWMAWAGQDRPGHQSIVPFADLAPEVQAYDDPYRDAVNEVRQELGLAAPLRDGETLWRKRPVTVAARELTAASAAGVAAWCGGRLEEIPGGSVVVWVRTQRGEVPAYDGDWVIRGPRGFWVCEAADFPGTYEPAGGAA